MTNYGSEILGANAAATVSPGVYSRIAVSGNAALTMAPGIYIIEGGGLSVTGNASLLGSGVVIVNAGSSYPVAGGNYGGIMLSGNGRIEISAPIDGDYAGIALYQTRDNSRDISFSGNATSGLEGTIYAATAAVNLSGNARLHGSLVARTLNFSGNASQSMAGEEQPAQAGGFSAGLLEAVFSFAERKIAELVPEIQGALAAFRDLVDGPCDNLARSVVFGELANDLELEGVAAALPPQLATTGCSGLFEASE
jgi:hypothetical protein